MSPQDPGATDAPAPTAPEDQTIDVLMRPADLEDIDAWIALRPYKLSRADALRQLALAKARIDLDSGD